MTKSSPSIWHYVVSVKSPVKILSIFVALENMNFIVGQDLVASPFEGSLNISKYSLESKAVDHQNCYVIFYQSKKNLALKN